MRVRAGLTNPAFILVELYPGSLDEARALLTGAQELQVRISHEADSQYGGESFLVHISDVSEWGEAVLSPEERVVMGPEFFFGVSAKNGPRDLGAIADDLTQRVAEWLASFGYGQGGAGGNFERPEAVAAG